MRKRTAESGGRPVWAATRRKCGTGLGEERVIQDATETAKADMAGVTLWAPSATGVIISWWQQAVSWWQQAVRQAPCCWAGTPRACSQRGICVPCAATPVIDRAHRAGAASTGATIQGNSRSKTIKAIRRTNRRKPRTALQSRNVSQAITTQRPSNVNAPPTGCRAFWTARFPILARAPRNGQPHQKERKTGESMVHNSLESAVPGDVIDIDEAVGR